MRGTGPRLACLHCDRLFERVEVPPRATANCTRCGFVLYRGSRLSLGDWIALTLASLLVFAIANAFPIARVSVQGTTRHATLLEALSLTWQQGHEVTATLTGLFGFVFPLVQMILLLWALRVLKAGRLPGDFRLGMRCLYAVHRWSMVPVLLLGIIVAMVKLADLARLSLAPGVWAFAALAFLLTGLSRVSAHRLWRLAEDRGLVEPSGASLVPGEPYATCLVCGCTQHSEGRPGNRALRCRRCDARLHLRKPQPATRTFALVMAATILYIPANILPVMEIRSLIGSGARTILGGVLELWNMGSWHLALVVFVASVIVPMTKLMALLVLLARHRWRGPVMQRQRTRLYELVEFIGQWSMLDVFVVLLLTAMVNFPGLTQIIAAPGAAYFGMVVVLTMWAAMSYDPRTGWDAMPSTDARTKSDNWKRT